MPIEKEFRGFTLLEMMVVVAIIAILAGLALPSFESRVIRKQILESVELIKPLKDRITILHSTTGMFPKDNKDAGIPEPEKLLGNYVQRVDLVEGALHITFGNKATPKLKDKIYSLRPIVVTGSPESPISWICGYATVPEGMQAVSENRTNVEGSYAPLICF